MERRAHLAGAGQHVEAADRERARRPGFDGADAHRPAQRLLQAELHVSRKLPSHGELDPVTGHASRAKRDSDQRQRPAAALPP